MRIVKGLKAAATASLLAASLLSLSTATSQALPAPVAVAGKSAVGVWGTGSIVGIASFLVVYDIIRRDTLVLTKEALDDLTARLKKE